MQSHIVSILLVSFSVLVGTLSMVDLQAPQEATEGVQVDTLPYTLHPSEKGSDGYMVEVDQPSTIYFSGEKISVESNTVTYLPCEALQGPYNVVNEGRVVYWENPTSCLNDSTESSDDQEEDQEEPEESKEKEVDCQDKETYGIFLDGEEIVLTICMD